MNAINPITPRTETVIILQGDDDERLRLLEAEVERLEKAKPRKDALPRTVGEVDAVTEWEDAKQAAIQARDDFKAEARERGVKVILRALGRKTWRDLVAKHPPRDGDEYVADKQMGANVDDLQEELVPLCMASPAGSNEQRAAFLDSLNEGQFGHLAVTAWGLNMGRGADPTQRLLSEGSQNSAATSS